MTIVTDEDFIRAMREAVAERGEDWTYPEARVIDGPEGYAVYEEDDWHVTYEGACVYSLPDGSPACLIGLALSKLGVTVPRDVIASAYDLFGDSYSEVFTSRVTEDVRNAASFAQMKQDNAKTWGEALEAFEDLISE